MTRRTLPLSPAGLMAWPAGRVHVFSACRVRNRRRFFCKLEKRWNLSFFLKVRRLLILRGGRRRAKEGRKKKVVGGRSRGVVRGGAGHPPSEFGQRHLRPIGSVTNEGGKEPMGGARSWNLQRFSPAPPSLSIPEKKKFLSLPLSPLLLLLRVRHKRPSERFSFSWAPGARWLRRAPSLTLLILFSVDKKLFQIKIKFCTSLSFSLLETPSKIKKKNQKIKIFQLWLGSFPLYLF